MTTIWRRSAFSPSRLFKYILAQLKRSYLDPMRDPDRKRLLIAGFIGVLATAMQSMVLNFSVAQEGATTTLIYHVVRLLLLGTIGIPLSLWLHSFSWGKWGIAFTQITGTCCLLYGIDKPVLCAVGFVLTCGPFWGLFSKTYAVKQSQDNRGHETALYVFMQTIASSLGICLGGVLLEIGVYGYSIIAAGICIVLSTFIVSRLLPADPIADIILSFFSRLFANNNPYKKAWNLIDKRKPTTQLTFLSAMVAAMIDIGLPTWMSLLEMAPVSAGISLSLRPILGLALTPIVGNLAQKSSLRVGQLGAIFMLAGWAILTFTIVYPIMLLPAIAIWGVANNLIGPTEAGWWFKKRSAAGVVAREILLATGRLPALGVMLPLLFLSPATFPLVGLSGSIFFLYNIQRINRKINFRNALGWRANNRSQ